MLFNSILLRGTKQIAYIQSDSPLRSSQMNALKLDAANILLIMEWTCGPREDYVSRRGMRKNLMCLSTICDSSKGIHVAAVKLMVINT